MVLEHIALVIFYQFSSRFLSVIQFIGQIMHKFYYFLNLVVNSCHKLLVHPHSHLNKNLLTKKLSMVLKILKSRDFLKPIFLLDNYFTSANFSQIYGNLLIVHLRFLLLVYKSQLVIFKYPCSITVYGRIGNCFQLTL